MKYIGGTKEAVQLIKKLQKNGDLINFYTREYFASKNDNNINEKVFDELVKEYGSEFVGHLLIGCFHGEDNYLTDLINLVEIQDPHILQFDNAPSFLFFNLATQSILILGMWRRKKQTIEEIIYSNLPNSKEKFENLDYFGIIDLIRREFENVADGMYPTNDGYSMGELDDMIIGKNGRYFLEEDEANEVDEDNEDEGITEEGIEERRNELEFAKEVRMDAQYKLQYYFPKFEVDNLWE